MPQSLSMIYLHIIFSTKNRYPFLNNQNIRNHLYTYMAGICKNLSAPAIIIGGTADHVHLLTRFSRTLTVSHYLKEMKRHSSTWIKEKYPQLKKFHWQNGYGVFSIGASQVDNVIQYIKNQEQHHQKISFQDEFRQICKLYGIEIDERYVWD
ncbi:MAG: IS200/IS605 family transposase [Methanobacteriota archaeon]|nr:MAG: IS200/IS605 family transposase [Euryarchaeota archaeon]